jgi:hypothetical protein
MDRRGFLTGLGALGLGAYWRPAARTGAVELACGPFDGYGVQRCEAGIDSALMDVAAADRQERSQWCWAACIEAVFNYYGHAVSQERIVEEAWGRVVDMPGSPYQILRSLNRRWTDDDGGEFRAFGTTFGTNAVTAAQDLAADRPLIVGTLGHAMVLTSLQYVRNAYGGGQVTMAVVRDPWPTNPRRRGLSPQEWYAMNFAARIRVEDL